MSEYEMLVEAKAQADKKRSPRVKTPKPADIGEAMGDLESRRRECVDGPTPEDRFHERTDAYRGHVHRAGIPERFKTANLTQNCDIYAGEDGKDGALEKSKEWAESGELMDRGRPRLCLILQGPYGTGKTWLATAAFKERIWKGLDSLRGGATWVKYYNFMRDVQDGYGDDTARQRLASYQSAPLLLIDDVGGFEKDVSDDRRQLFYELVDSRSDHLLPTIMTTNLEKSDLIGHYGERVYNRLIEMAVIVPMTGKNYRVD